MRIFLAVGIPEPIRCGISRLQGMLAGRGVRDIRWAGPSGIHLTLRFCGEVPPDTLLLLSKMLAPGAPIAPFRTGLRRLGVFPPRGTPRVLYLALADSESLPRLASWVEERVEAAGMPPERRRFQAHLTLGRFRSGAGPVSLDRLEVSEELTREEIPVDRFGIYQSHLDPGGSRYELLQEFSLRGEERS